LTGVLAGIPVIEAPIKCDTSDWRADTCRAADCCFSPARPTATAAAMADAAPTPMANDQLSGPALAEPAVSASLLDSSTVATDGSCHKRAHEAMAAEEGKDGGEDSAPATPLHKKHKRLPIAPESTSAFSPSSASSSAAIAAAVPSAAPSSAPLNDDSVSASQLGSSAQMHPRNLYRLRPPVSCPLRQRHRCASPTITPITASQRRIPAPSAHHVILLLATGPDCESTGFPGPGAAVSILQTIVSLADFSDCGRPMLR